MGGDVQVHGKHEWPHHWRNWTPLPQPPLTAREEADFKGAVNEMHKFHEEGTQWLDVRVIIYQSWFLSQEVQSLCQALGRLAPCTCVSCLPPPLTPPSFPQPDLLFLLADGGPFTCLSSFNCGPLCLNDQSQTSPPLVSSQKSSQMSPFRKPSLNSFPWTVLCFAPSSFAALFLSFSCAFWVTRSLVTDCLSF